ncbi:MAG: hypothetical protein MJ025_01600 [Victivallaceae bacterium]|nr:hypothetical protein [Victivallaceae bacterium]
MNTEKSGNVCPNCGYRKPARPVFPFRPLSGVIAPPYWLGKELLDRLFRAFCPRCGTKMKKEK